MLNTITAHNTLKIIIISWFLYKYITAVILLTKGEANVLFELDFKKEIVGISPDTVEAHVIHSCSNIKNFDRLFDKFGRELSNNRLFDKFWKYD